MKQPPSFAFYTLLFLAAGTLATSVRLIADRMQSRWSGLLLLAPVVTILVFATLAFQGKTADTDRLVRAAFWGLPPLCAFLLALWLASKVLDPRLALMTAILVWLIAAVLCSDWNTQ